MENNRWAVDREELKRIPIGNGSVPDKIIWHYTTNRNYTVKSGYFLAQQGIESHVDYLQASESYGDYIFQTKSKYTYGVSFPLPCQSEHILFVEVLLLTRCVPDAIHAQRIFYMHLVLSPRSSSLEAVTVVSSYYKFWEGLFWFYFLLLSNRVIVMICTPFLSCVGAYGLCLI